MTNLRTIVAQIVSGAPFPSKRSQNKAIDILDAIEAAGFRILGPDEVDPVTVEKAAALVERDEIDGFVRLDPKRHKNLSDWFAEQRASAIRALGRKA